jgi:hypothetical protein
MNTISNVNYDYFKLNGKYMSVGSILDHLLEMIPLVEDTEFDDEINIYDGEENKDDENL